MYVVLLCHGSLLYSYAHVSLVFIKRFWEYKRTKNILKNEQKSRDAAVKKNRYKRSRDK